jgi:hypothetical protein
VNYISRFGRPLQVLLTVFQITFPLIRFTEGSLLDVSTAIKAFGIPWSILLEKNFLKKKEVLIDDAKPG